MSREEMGRRRSAEPTTLKALRNAEVNAHLQEYRLGGCDLVTALAKAICKLDEQNHRLWLLIEELGMGATVSPLSKIPLWLREGTPEGMARNCMLLLNDCRLPVSNAAMSGILASVIRHAMERARSEVLSEVVAPNLMVPSNG